MPLRLQWDHIPIDKHKPAMSEVNIPNELHAALETQNTIEATMRSRRTCGSHLLPSIAR